MTCALAFTASSRWMANRPSPTVQISTATNPVMILLRMLSCASRCDTITSGLGPMRGNAHAAIALHAGESLRKCDAVPAAVGMTGELSRCGIAVTFLAPKQLHWFAKRRRPARTRPAAPRRRRLHERTNVRSLAVDVRQGPAQSPLLDQLRTACADHGAGVLRLPRSSDSWSRCSARNGT